MRRGVVAEVARILAELAARFVLRLQERAVSVAAVVAEEVCHRMNSQKQRWGSGVRRQQTRLTIHQPR